MLQLFSYYRSTAAYRVRIALNWKNIPYEIIPVNLLHAAHKKIQYKDINPQQRVPTLQEGKFLLGQSLAIIEYLEEKYPTPTLFPKGLKERAQARYIANIIACDIHPLNNSGTMNYLKNEFKHTQEEITRWYHHWLKEGFDAIESYLKKNSNSNNYCLGETVTLADMCLIPQVYSAYRFGFAMENYPLILKINEHCLSLPAFNKARPENQPDAV